jgi:hypothetical protein
MATNFGPQIGPPVITNINSTLSDPPGFHYGLTLGTIATRRGAPLFFTIARRPQSASLVTTAAPAAPAPFDRIAAEARNPVGLLLRLLQDGQRPTTGATRHTRGRHQEEGEE